MNPVKTGTCFQVEPGVYLVEVTDAQKSTICKLAEKKLGRLMHWLVTPSESSFGWLPSDAKAAGCEELHHLEAACQEGGKLHRQILHLICDSQIRRVTQHDLDWHIEMS